MGLGFHVWQSVLVFTQISSVLTLAVVCVALSAPVSLATPKANGDKSASAKPSPKKKGAAKKKAASQTKSDSIEISIEDLTFKIVPLPSADGVKYPNIEEVTRAQEAVQNALGNIKKIYRDIDFPTAPNRNLVNVSVIPYIIPKDRDDDTLRPEGYSFILNTELGGIRITPNLRSDQLERLLVAALFPPEFQANGITFQITGLPRAIQLLEAYRSVIEQLETFDESGFKWAPTHSHVKTPLVELRFWGWEFKEIRKPHKTAPHATLDFEASNCEDHLQRSLMQFYEYEQ